MSYTGEIRVSRNSALSSIGAAGLLLDAVAVGAAVTAAAAVVVAAALVTLPARLAGNAIRNARVGRVRSELADAAENAEKISAQLDEKMRAASEDCYKSYGEAVERLKEIYEKEHDYAAFASACTEAREKLYRDIAEKKKALESRYISEINDSVSRSRNEMEIERRRVEDSIQRIADSEEKKKKAAELAENILAETEAFLEGMRAGNESAHCGRLIDECLAMCAAARKHMGNEMYEAALADAFSARNAALLRLSDIMKKETENAQRYTDVKAALTAAEKLLDDNRRASFVFDKTRDGEPVNAETEDFAVYYRGKFEEYENVLNGIKARFESASDYRDLAYAELEDALSEISRWQDGFIKETLTAYERLENTMLRCETADLLMDKYEAEGYEILPPTEEDEAVSVLDSIIIRMEHGVTGERLCMRLSGEPDADGHIGMVINIEDHTKYKGNDGEVEAARENTRSSVCSAITDSNIGKGMQTRQRCTNPGVRDEEH